MNKKKISWIIQVALGLFVGGFMGFYISSLLFEDQGFGLDMMIYFLIFAVVSYILHIIFHEGGHALFGILGGFEFVSFRIGSYMWSLENGKLKYSRYRLSGSGGQCLMLPKNEKLESYVLYNAGGGLMNLLVAVLFLGLNAIFHDTLFQIFGINMVAIGFLLGLFNLIPFDAGIPNDGYNIYCILKDRKSLHSMYQQLILSKELADGKRIDEIDEEILTLYEGADLKNPLNTCIQANYGTRLLVLKKYDEAKEVLLELKRLPISNIYEQSVSVDLALTRLLSEDLNGFLLGIDEKMMKSFQKERNAVYTLALMVGVEWLVNRDDEAAKVSLKYFRDACRTYPYQGIVSEVEQIVELLQERKNEND